jgi:CheY-like chemotaxis protein
MNGSIDVRSEVGKGSIFSIKLNIRICNKEDILKDSIEADIVEMKSNSKRYKILIAEDNENNRIFLNDILSRFDFEIKEAHDGLECVEIYKEFLPDIIFMDRKMPNMSGDEAAKIIKELQSERVVIVALTANALKDDFVENLGNYIDDVVLKPFSPKQIYDVLQKYLEVEFIYEDVSKKPKEENEDIESYLAYEFSKLDSHSLKKIYDSTLLLSYYELEETIKPILESSNRNLYDTLMRIAKEFKYDVIIDAIKNQKNFLMRAR